MSSVSMDAQLVVEETLDDDGNDSIAVARVWERSRVDIGGELDRVRCLKGPSVDWGRTARAAGVVSESDERVVGRVVSQVVDPVVDVP